MKKILLIFAAVLVFFASCKKENSDNNGNNDNPSGYFVKFKLNGNWVIWTNVYGELGPDLGDDSKTNFGVSANDGKIPGDLLDLNIQIDGPNFTTGTYTDDNPNYIFWIDYLNSNLDNFSNNAIEGPDSKYTLNVTSITSTELRGNFNGNLLYDHFADSSLYITEGEFFVKRLR